MAEKTALRQILKQRKRECGAAEMARQSAVLMQRLAEHPLFVASRTVLLFHALPDEPDTHSFIRHWAQSKQILLPTVVGDDLELHPYTADLMTTGAFGIKESAAPVFTDYAAIGLAVVPGVAFDATGHRLGRGKGYYDRLLSRPEMRHVYKLGLCFDFQKLPQVPAEPHDVIMDEVL